MNYIADRETGLAINKMQMLTTQFVFDKEDYLKIFNWYVEQNLLESVNVTFRPPEVILVNNEYITEFSIICNEDLGIWYQD